MENLSPDIKNFLLVLTGIGIPLVVKFSLWALQTIFKKEKELTKAIEDKIFEKIENLKTDFSETNLEIKAIDSKVDNIEMILNDLKGMINSLESKSKDNHYEIKGVNKKVHDVRDKFIKYVLKSGQDVDFDADLWNDFSKR